VEFSFKPILENNFAVPKFGNGVGSNGTISSKSGTFEVDMSLSER